MMMARLESPIAGLVCLSSDKTRRKIVLEPAPIKPIVALTDLHKLDIRVGMIVAVSEVANSDQLVEMRVDFGNHQRTVVVGMKRERANPREVEGRQALFIVNLEPRTVRGIVSEAMLFDIGYDDGITPRLACPEAEVPNGTRAG